MPGNSKKYLITFKSGSVSVFNVDKRQTEFMTEGSHRETIFDVKFKPDNKDILASCGYDGTIKIWDLYSSKIINSISIEPDLKKAFKDRYK
jgi:WD40 repeat protein